VVHRAWDPVIGREVALKCLELADFSDAQADEIRERFRREAMAAGRLNHPNIITVFDVGEQDGEAFIAMEYVKGGSLDVLLSQKTLPSFRQVEEIISAIAHALDHAHEMGIIHRDIKPGNILMPEDGGVKVTDFGIARIEDSRITREGAMLGSPSYMSPEQVLGKEIDRRSDVFSLGVILYIMLTGEKPFPGDSLATLSYKIVQEDPKPPSRIRSDLDPAIDEVASRFKAVVDGIDDVGAVTAVQQTIGEETVFPTLTVLPIALKERLEPFKRWVWGVTAVVLLVALIIVGFYYLPVNVLKKYLGVGGIGATAVATPGQLSYKPLGIVPRPYLLWRDAIEARDDGDLKKARPLLRELTLLNPDDAEAHLELGKLQHKLDDIRRALQSYRRALNLDSGLRSDPALISNLVSVLGTKRGQDASGILAEFVGDSAKNALVEAAAGTDAARSRDALRTLVKMWRLKLEKNPGDADTRLAVARALYRLKEFGEVLEEYGAVIKTRPEARGDAEIILNVIEMLDTRYRNQASKLLVESIGPSALEALRKVGQDRGAKMYGRARKALRSILEGQRSTDKQNAQAPLELAFMYEGDGDISASMAAISDALDRNPSLGTDKKVMALFMKAFEKNNREKAREILVSKIGKAAVPALKTALSSDNYNVRWNAVAALKDLNEGASFDMADILARDLTDAETSCRQKRDAAEKLANMGTEKSANIIRKALNNSGVRRCGLKTFKEYLKKAGENIR